MPCASHMRCTCTARILSLCLACALSLSSLLYKSSPTIAPRLPATKLICSNIHTGAADLSASMMLLFCSLASPSYTPRKSLFLSDEVEILGCLVFFLLITFPSSLPCREAKNVNMSASSNSCEVGNHKEGIALLIASLRNPAKMAEK